MSEPIRLARPDVGAAEPREQQRGLVVARGVVGVEPEELLENRQRVLRPPGVRVLHRQAVVGEGVGGTFADEFFQRFQSRFRHPRLLY